MLKYILAAIAAFFINYSYSSTCPDNNGFCKRPESEQILTCFGSEAPTSKAGACPHVAQAIEDAIRILTIDDQAPNHKVLEDSLFSFGADYWNWRGSKVQVRAQARYVDLPDSCNTNYPDRFTYNADDFCRIKTCSDGFYGDPSQLGNVCDRPKPTPDPRQCGLTDLVMTTPPIWPQCSRPPDMPTPEPDKECTPYLGIGWSTTYCIVNQNQACINGICRSGCGTIDGEYICFGDDLDADNDGMMDKTNQLDGVTDPNDMDKPSTANGCRAINGKSFCPQDPVDFIKPDGTFPSGCGFINDDFFCQPDGLANNPHTGLDTDYDNTDITGAGDNLINGLLTRLDNNQQVGFQNIGAKIVEQTQGLLQGMKSIEQTIKDKPVSGVGTPTDPDGEPTPSKEPDPDYTLPTSGSVEWFKDVLGQSQIVEIQNKTQEKRGEIDTLIADFKNLLTVEINSLSATYDPHIVQIKGVSLELGAKALDQFSNLGIQHIIWLVVVLSGVSIILVRR